MINISRMYQNFFNNIFKCKEQPKELQIGDIITCKDDVQFKIINTGQRSYSYRVKLDRTIDLELLNKKGIVPIYTIMESNIPNFIFYRYNCKNDDGCIRYRDSDIYMSVGKIIEPYEHMKYYEREEILRIWKDKYRFNAHLINIFNDMTNSGFDTVYKDLLYKQELK